MTAKKTGVEGANALAIVARTVPHPIAPSKAAATIVAMRRHARRATGRSVIKNSVLKSLATNHRVAEVSAIKNSATRNLAGARTVPPVLMGTDPTATARIVRRVPMETARVRPVTEMTAPRVVISVTAHRGVISATVPPVPMGTGPTATARIVRPALSGIGPNVASVRNVQKVLASVHATRTRAALPCPTVETARNASETSHASGTNRVLETSHAQAAASVNLSHATARATRHQLRARGSGTGSPRSWRAPDFARAVKQKNGSRPVASASMTRC